MKFIFRMMILCACTCGFFSAVGNGPGDSAVAGKSDTAKAAAAKPAVQQNPGLEKKNDSWKIPFGPPMVERVYRYAGPPADTGKAAIGDIIVIKVANLDSLIKAAGEQKIALFIEGRKIDKIEPLSGAIDRDNGTLQYHLDRNSDNDKIWADILGEPPLSGAFFIKAVKVSVGPANGFAIRTSGEGSNFNIIRIHYGWFWICCLLFLGYIYIFFQMVKKHGLLRDRVIDLSAIGVDTTGMPTTYSLGRFQMAFWFTLTVISFFFIWLITDAYNIISTTVLALIGISSATALGAAVMDDSKNTDILNQTITLQNEWDTLGRQITGLQAQVAIVPAPANALVLQAQLATALTRKDQITPVIAANKKALTPQPSSGFLNDILKDANGISFHRLQMFVWTFVLGTIFLYSVWKSLSMPDFDGTLLALQGITAGTYLGFKIPEKQS